MSVQEGFRGVTVKSLIRYVSIGGITALLYLGSVYILRDLVGLSSTISVVLSYLLAVAFHFSANRSLTFDATSGEIRQQLFRYALLALFSFLVQMVTLVGLNQLFGVYFYISLIVSSLASLILGFLLSLKWVFREASGK